MNKSDLRQFFAYHDSVLKSRLTRRGLLGRAAVIGASIPLGSAILAACEADDEGDSDADDDVDVDESDEGASEEEDEVDPEAEDEDPGDTDEADESEEDDEAAEDSDESSGDKVIVIGHHLDPVTLNASDTTTAAFQSVYDHISEQLVVFNPDMEEIEPWLATDWEWLDEQTLEMRLREGIEFTNGELFNAEAAKFSIDVFTESDSYAFLLPEEVYSETEVIDEYTIQIHLNEAYAPFLGFLARGGAVFPPEYYEEVGTEGFGQDPIGTGPFYLEEWQADSQLTLLRNEDYWDGPHPISEVIYRVIPENTARTAALETGEIDIALNVPVSSLERLGGVEGVEVIEVPGLRKFAVHFQTIGAEDSPLADPLVRQALNHAVDKQAIADSLYQGAADPLQGQWQVEGEAGHNPDIEAFEYDPELARELLAEAGYPDGFEFDLAYTVGRYPIDQEQGEIVASYIEEAGVTVNQDALEYGTFTTRRDDETLGTHLWGLLLPPDPHFNFNLFIEGSIYETHHLGSEFTQLVEEGAQETDDEAREEIYNRIAEIMHEDPPMLYLVVPRDIYAHGPRVQNFTPRRDQVLWLFDVDVTE